LTKDFTDQEIFWALADLFDPDAFVTYAPTWEEMSKIDPRIYREQMSAWREHVTQQVSEEEAERFVSSAQTEAAFHPKATEKQITLINRRLSPLSDPGPDDGPLDWFDGSNPVGWPFTEISEFETLPDVISVPTTQSGAARRLLLMALRGRAPAALVEALTERNVEFIEEPISRYEMGEVIRNRGAQPATPPVDLSMIGLATFHTGGLLRTPAALVVGDSPWDFALFYALLRLTGRAWWLPSWLRRDPAYRMSLESSIRFDPRNEGRQAVVVSASSFAARDEVARTINELHNEKLDIADWKDVLPSEPLRVLASDTTGRARLVPLVDGDVLELDTPIPALARTRIPAEMRWLSEARSADWAPIRHMQLGARLLPGDSDIVRTSRTGMAYFSTSSFIFSGASLESVVVRPSLRPISLSEQVRVLLDQKGWKCEISDKAIYGLEAMKLFGGFDPLCDALRDSGVRSIIDAYRGEPNIAPCLSHDNRRYLMFSHFEQLVGAENARSIVEPLLDRQVLTRGVVLKCIRCRQAAWHSAASAPGRFTCGRCGLAQDVNREAWFGTAEPAMSYRLAEILFQLLEHDGELPLLAARVAFGDSKRPIGRGYELDVTPPGEKTQEVDIFQSDGYRLWIGEASTAPQFEAERLEFLSRLSQVLDAYGVLLATSRPKWHPGTEEFARQIFPGPWPQLRLLVGVQTRPDNQEDGDQSGSLKA
jgi:hypothetical protein